MMDNHFTPPNNVEAEQSVLGSIMLDNDQHAECVALIGDGNCFYKEAHRKIWRSISRLIADGSPADLVTVIDDLRNRGQLDEIGGVAYLVGLSESVPTSVYVAHYAEIVTKASYRRDLINTSMKILSMARELDEPVEALYARALNLVTALTPAELTATTAHLGDGLERVFKELEDQANGIVPEGSVLWGFQSLDNKFLNPMRPGNVYVIAGATSMGKTTLAMQVGASAALAGRNVDFFSLEMENDEIDLKMVAMLSKVGLNRFKKLNFTAGDWDAVNSSARRMNEMPFWLHTPFQSTLEIIQSTLREAKARRGLGIVIIDYLQLVETLEKFGTRQEAVQHVSRSIKKMAREFKVPIIALSQLSNEVEKRADHRPVLADLRESGAIKNDASVVAFVYRDEYYNKDTKNPGVTEVIVPKQRSGPVGTCELKWHKSTASFGDNVVEQGML